MRPFLQLGLRIALRFLGCGDPRVPIALDERTRRGQTSVGVYRTDQRLANVSKHACSHMTPPLLRTFAHADMLRKVDLARNGSTRLAAHQAMENAREFALGRIGKARDQHVGNDEAEHAVTEEFQALVGLLLAAVHRARVRERPGEQIGIGETVAERVLEAIDPARRHKR